MQRKSDLKRLYLLLDRLEQINGGKRLLRDCHGKLSWPDRGVYFFFEPGEMRSDRHSSRVVRVGTHALTEHSKSRLWQRLRQHKGKSKAAGGNHRGSVFRLLVGEAMINRDPKHLIETWGKGSSASPEIRTTENNLEAEVSRYLGDMSLLFLPVPDAPGKTSLRGRIERNSIALLSNFNGHVCDPPSANWLGTASKPKVRQSGLWNSNHVEEGYDPHFFDDFEQLIDSSRH